MSLKKTVSLSVATSFGLSKKSNLNGYRDLKPLNKLDRISFNALVLTMFEPLNPFSYACGYINNGLAKELVPKILKSICSNCISPLNFISIGTGSGIWEKMIKPFVNSISCYDISPQTVKGLDVQTKDVRVSAHINEILPNDCSNCVLFSAYPEGYLTKILAEFGKRNGTRLITVSSESLLSDAHAGLEENPKVFESILDRFIGNPAKCFRFEVGGNEDLGISFFECIGPGFLHLDIN